MNKEPVAVFWLIPAEPERELFRKLIRILAAEFDAPRFDPHLTLGEVREGKSPRQELRTISFKRLRLRIRGIAFSSKFTKSLFVRFEPNRELERLIASVAKDRKSLRGPHLSLIYKKLSATTKRQLASTIRLPFRYVTFDVIKAAECVSPTKTARDVKKWRLIGKKCLL